MANKYIDFKLIEEYPNKYNLSPKNIKNLKILDWEKLKNKTWHNDSLTGNWWCHLEGCNLEGEYNDEDEFWIGFNEDDDRIDCHFTAFEGMCDYYFDEFYRLDDIENIYDMNVQINVISWLNKMIDEGILGV